VLGVGVGCWVLGVFRLQQVLGVGCWVLGVFRIQQVLGVKCWVLGVRCAQAIAGVGCWVLGVLRLQQATAGYSRCCDSRVGQDHIYTTSICCFWHGHHQIYRHIQCVYTVMADLK